MSLASGTHLGPYEIVSPLGAGGMGEVYRARDRKLNRDVALKVLPEAFATNVERMARFEREAQVLASLNHANIAAIYGLEESGATRALVMELVEGQTLAERLSVAANYVRRESSATEVGDRRSPLQLDDALPIARQVADALEYAHERGIIHRDLKPANIKITPEGTVKVLDFGLAKALDTQDSAADISNSPTMMTAATQAGVILGTAAYMSPEQARGKTVDRRADIWAFGCVLYEMLAGKRPFEGETVTDVLAAVVRAEPDWDALPADIPPRIRELVRRCLTKDPKQRLRDIGDARIAIDEAISGDVGAHLNVLPSEGAHAGALLQPRLRAQRWALALGAVVIAALAGWWYGTRGAPTQADWSGELLPGPTIAFWPRVAPDSHLIAFQALVNNMTQVAVLDPGSGNWSVLTQDRTHGLIASLSWSHDGSKIYFDRFTSQPLGVYSVPALGGEGREVLSNAATPEALPDGSLLLVRVDPDRRNQIYHFWPENGQLEALGAWVAINPSAPLRVFPDGKAAVFYGTAKGPGFDNSPHLYLLNIASGSAQRLAPELSIVQSAQLFSLAVAPDGQSVLIDLPSGNLHRIVAIPRSGKGPVHTLFTLTSAPWSLDVAPDGSLYIDQIHRPLEILRFTASGGIPDVLASIETYTQNNNAAPVELPDGRFLLPALISGRPRLLLGKPGESFVPLLQTNEETAPPMTRVGNDEIALMVGSPPARSLALASVNEGRIIRRIQSTEGKGIDAVAASPDGISLFYVSSGTVWSVPSQGGSPREICAGDGVAVDPDGRYLIVNLNEREKVRLERIPFSGGPAQTIQVGGDLPISPIVLGLNAINKDNKLLTSVAPRDSWFFGLGVVDLATGTLTRVPLNYMGDILVPGWTGDGRILATGYPMQAHIWRFRPIH